MHGNDERQCPLCGRSDFSFPISAAKRAALNQSQFRHLSYALEALEGGQITVERLRQQITDMCAMCQMLMIGISSQNDSMELQERIKKEMQTLRSEFAQAA